MPTKNNLPKIGSIWKDRDPRQKGRTVRVYQADETHVRYKGAIAARSKVARFLKAFELVK